MNNDPYNNSGSNWEQQPNQMYNSELAPNVPNSNGSFVLGIVSICVSVVCFCCYGGFPSFITSLIGLILGARAIRTYNEKSFKKAKTGRLLNIISLIIAILGCLWIIVYLYLAFTHQLPPEFQRQFDDNMRKYD